MADTKISAATNNGAVASTDELATNKAGASNRTAASAIKTFVTNAPVFAAGTASANTWPKFTSGTVLTTPEVGVIELDTTNFYGTTDAGNQGYLPVRHFIRADATRTLPNNTNLNPIFNSPTNGRITLETGLYMFEGIFIVTGMSATSGNALVNIRGAGTATMAAWMWVLNGLDTTGSTVIADDDAVYSVTEATAASAVAVAVNTVMRFWIKGTVEVTGAGTVIPSIQLVTATAAAIVSIGSYFMIERMGSTTVVSIGQWD